MSSNFFFEFFFEKMAFSRATARAIVDIIDRNDFKLPLKLRTERIKDGISAHPEIHSQDDLIELLARTDELTIFSEISNLNLRYHNNVQLTIHFDLSPNGEFNFFEEELDPHDELGSLNFHFTRSYLGHGEEPPRYHVTTLPALLGLIKGIALEIEPLYGLSYWNELSPGDPVNSKVYREYPNARNIRSRNIRDVHRINYWDKELVEKIGRDWVNTTPHFAVDELENRAVLVYVPIKHWKGGFPYGKARKEAEEHLGFLES